MEEFNERVSVIGKSPVILKIWQFNYRQLLCFLLVLSIFAITSTAMAQEDKVTRYQFVSAIYERIYNRQVSELEAINTGLIDAYEDGKYHLEWPMSRGMAAHAFLRLNQQAGSLARAPRAFADIGGESSFKRVLEVVGAAFLPQQRGNFNANHMLSRKDLFRAIQIMIEKNLVKQEDRYGMEIPVVTRPVEDDPDAALRQKLNLIDPIRPELGFEERNSEREKFKQEAYRRLTRADEQVTVDQLNPQAMSSVEDAAGAMGDVEDILKNLGGSVLEMTGTYPSNPDDERALRQGLSKIEEVLKTIVERFKYSRLQLNTIMPVDPDQIRKCADLEVRFKETIEQAETLRRRIAGRLAEPEKGGEP